MEKREHHRLDIDWIANKSDEQIVADVTSTIDELTPEVLLLEQAWKAHTSLHNFTAYSTAYRDLQKYRAFALLPPEQVRLNLQFSVLQEQYKEYIKRKIQPFLEESNCNFIRRDKASLEINSIIDRRTKREHVNHNYIGAYIFPYLRLWDERFRETLSLTYTDGEWESDENEVH